VIVEFITAQNKKSTRKTETTQYGLLTMLETVIVILVF